MTAIMGVRFANLSAPWNRRFPFLVALAYFTVFGMMPVVCIGLTLTMLLTLQWIPLALYAVWYYYDRKKSRRGGRSCWLVRNFPTHKYFARYFPLKMHKTAEMPTDQNYLLACHPHGIFGVGSIINFATNGTGTFDKFAGIKFHLCTLVVNFSTPLWREFLMAAGLIECSKSSIKYTLSHPKKGHAVALVVGGAEEALEAHPGVNRLTLANRKGFVKIALQTGAHLVPVYNFGENDIYHQVPNPPGSAVRSFQSWLKAKTGIAPALFHGRGLFQYAFGILPFGRPINTVVGTPIPVEKCEHPTQEQIDELHNKYMSDLRDLFNTYKTKYGYGEEDILEIQ